MAVCAEQFKGKVTIADGAWAAELDRLGCPAGHCREEWNLSQPDSVRQVPQAYVKAGARIVLTNTFGANRIALLKYQQDGQTRRINEAGVRISKQAADGRALVFGSIGPSGKMVLTGETNPDELFEAFKEQAEALAEGGADALVVESMTELAEAQAAVRAACTTGLLVVGCMLFDSGQDRAATAMGVSAEVAAAKLAEAGAGIVGCNCGIGIENDAKIIARMRAAVNCPLWAKPNAGTPEIEGGNIVYRMSPDEFAARAADLVAAGAGIIGGCCGTTPEFIRALSDTYKS